VVTVATLVVLMSVVMVFVMALVIPMLLILVVTLYVNFKLSMFEQVSKTLFRIAGLEKQGDLDKEDARKLHTFSMNLSFLSEISFESLPQLVIMCINTFSSAREASDIAVISIVFSAVSIANAAYPIFYQIVKHKSIIEGLHQEIYPFPGANDPLAA